MNVLQSPPPRTGERLRLYAPRTLYRPALIAAVAIGVAVRAGHTLRSGFPLNDGGLFYAMVRDLQDAHYRLPDFTSYNHAGISFAYPPLGLYVAGLVDDFTPFDLLTVFRLLPLLYCVLMLPASFLLARRFLSSQVALVASVAAFGLIPRSFIWLIMGGGVTRGLGLLLAILALWQVHLLYTAGARRHLWAAILLSGATVLAHLETGTFLAFSVVVFWLFVGRNRAALVNSLLLAAGTLAVISPWLLTILARHGADPFLGALSSGSSVFSGDGTTRFVLLALSRLVWTSEAFFPLIGVLGVIGAVIAIKRGLYLLPAWWAVTILLDARAFHTYTAIPVAILAGYAVSEALLPFLSRGPGPATGNGTNGLHRSNGNGHGSLLIGQRLRGQFERLSVPPVALALGAVMLIASTVSAWSTSPGFSEVGVLTSLGSGQREAMDWIRQNTPDDARFLVIPRGGWQTDKESEWFPVFAGRTSVATVQGWEWIAGDGGFDGAVRAFDAAWDCGYKRASCLDRWMREQHRTFDYLYVPADVGVGCCGTLIESLWTESNYRMLYYGVGGSIYVRTAP